MSLGIELITFINKPIAQEIVALTKQIPEFENPYTMDDYLLKLHKKKHLLVVAMVENRVIAFKLGYEMNSTVFYSWMGCVLPTFRKQGVAKTLATAQERWVMEHDYSFIQMKTRNYLKNMLHFALSNNFYITGIEQHQNPMDNRIILKKDLKA